MSLLRTSLPKASLQPTLRLNPRIAVISPLNISKRYASTRRQITVANDDGRVHWSDLSGREKAARSTQQSWNFAVIVVGVAMTGAVGYLLFTDVFSPNSKTRYFNRSVSCIKASPACIEALGPANKMTFYGESMRSSFRRARVSGPTTVSKASKDERTGVETIKMRFMVKGDKAEGYVTMHLEKQPGDIEFEYVLLALDVQGHQRIVVEGDQHTAEKKSGPTKLFGVSWGSGRN